MYGISFRFDTTVYPNFYGYFNAKIIVWLSKGFLSIEAQERYKMKLLK